jgi:glucosamine-6-phosphate deaminase
MQCSYRSAEEAANHIVDEGWGNLNWLANESLTGSRDITLGRVIIRPGRHNRRHRHPGSEEVLYLLKGTLRHSIGDSNVVMNAGDTISIPAGVFHNAVNIGDEDADMIVAHSSGCRDFELEMPPESGRNEPVRQFSARGTQVAVYADKRDMGRAAAEMAGRLIHEAVARRGRSRVIVATGPSQDELVDALVTMPEIDWSKVEVFHMDEYVGIPATHRASFRRWLKQRVAEKVHPAAVHYLAGDADDLDAECRRYGALITDGIIDVCFVGFGENGHIAFNDPHVADFDDPHPVKRVVLDHRCRLQQVGEGHFRVLDDVPREAITLTCPTLLRAGHLICCVPDERKAAAVQQAIEGPLTTRCPASLVFTHRAAHVFLDVHSAVRLSREASAGT